MGSELCPSTSYYSPHIFFPFVPLSLMSAHDRNFKSNVTRLVECVGLCVKCDARAPQNN